MFASATAIVGTGNGSQGVWSSALMASDVQNWLDNPATNFGWIVVGNEAVPRAKRFDTRENPIVGRRPQLTIEFEPLWLPALEPAGVTLLVVVLAAVAAGSLRR